MPTVATTAAALNTLNTEFGTRLRLLWVFPTNENENASSFAGTTGSRSPSDASTKNPSVSLFARAAASTRAACAVSLSFTYSGRTNVWNSSGPNLPSPKSPSLRAASSTADAARSSRTAGTPRASPRDDSGSVFIKFGAGRRVSPSSRNDGAGASYGSYGSYEDSGAAASSTSTEATSKSPASSTSKTFSSPPSVVASTTISLPLKLPSPSSRFSSSPSPSDDRVTAFLAAAAASLLSFSAISWYALSALAATARGSNGSRSMGSVMCFPVITTGSPTFAAALSLAATRSASLTSLAATAAASCDPGRRVRDDAFEDEALDDLDALDAFDDVHVSPFVCFVEISGRGKSSRDS
mmetsp:Transcript_11712/g.38956  ORF Transcript_11712/g.38956 Transcript_11712/m.38956 type:complete len:353 (-) Transcript_11712:2424-3482(-)